MKSFLITLEKDGDDLIMPLPDDLLKEVDWIIGDTIAWSDNLDGSFTLNKKEIIESSPEEEEAWKELESKINSRNRE